MSWAATLNAAAVMASAADARASICNFDMRNLLVSIGDAGIVGMAHDDFVTEAAPSMTRGFGHGRARSRRAGHRGVTVGR